MRGRLTHDEHEREVELVRQSLRDSQRGHLQAYADAWTQGAG